MLCHVHDDLTQVHLSDPCEHSNTAKTFTCRPMFRFIQPLINIECGVCSVLNQLFQTAYSVSKLWVELYVLTVVNIKYSIHNIVTSLKLTVF